MYGGGGVEPVSKTVKQLLKVRKRGGEKKSDKKEYIFVVKVCKETFSIFGNLLPFRADTEVRH